MSCDICGANDKPLVDLIDTYKTKEIAQICPECEKIVNRKLSDIRVLTHGILKDLMLRFMAGMKGSK
jgi:hypothetical protein